MKKNVYTINGKRIVQGNQNILNDHEININNLSEIWYYRFPKGSLQDAFSSPCLEMYLVYSACILRVEDMDDDNPLIPIGAIMFDPESRDKVEKVDGLMVAADMPVAGFDIPISYREFPNFFAQYGGEVLPEKLKQYRCSKEDFYRMHSN